MLAVGNQLKLIKVPAVKSTHANEIGKRSSILISLIGRNDILGTQLEPKQIMKQILKILMRTKLAPELNSMEGYL